jgi:hypothetical protein
MSRGGTAQGVTIMLCGGPVDYLTVAFCDAWGGAAVSAACPTTWYADAVTLFDCAPLAVLHFRWSGGVSVGFGVFDQNDKSTFPPPRFCG